MSCQCQVGPAPCRSCRARTIATLQTTHCPRSAFAFHLVLPGKDSEASISIASLYVCKCKKIYYFCCWSTNEINIKYHTWLLQENTLNIVHSTQVTAVPSTVLICSNLGAAAASEPRLVEHFSSVAVSLGNFEKSHLPCLIHKLNKLFIAASLIRCLRVSASCCLARWAASEFEFMAAAFGDAPEPGVTGSA